MRTAFFYLLLIVDPFPELFLELLLSLDFIFTMVRETCVSSSHNKKTITHSLALPQKILRSS